MINQSETLCVLLILVEDDELILFFLRILRFYSKLRFVVFFVSFVDGFWFKRFCLGRVEDLIGFWVVHEGATVLFLSSSVNVHTLRRETLIFPPCLIWFEHCILLVGVRTERVRGQGERNFCNNEREVESHSRLPPLWSAKYWGIDVGHDCFLMATCLELIEGVIGGLMCARPRYPLYAPTNGCLILMV